MFVIVIAIGLGYYIGSKRCCNGCSCRNATSNGWPEDLFLPKTKKKVKKK
jgi:hypothetical protein